MQMDVTTQLKEGMQILPISEFKKNKYASGYTLIKSDKDGELYGHKGFYIIKLENIIEKDWICVDVDSLERTDTYIEIKKDDENTHISKPNNDSLHWELKDIIDDFSHYADDDGFTEISMRNLEMTREEYIKKQAPYSFNFSLRKTIKGYYDDAEDIGNGIKDYKGKPNK